MTWNRALRLPFGLILVRIKDIESKSGTSHLKRALFVGPMPPALGGISSILGMLHCHFAQVATVAFVDSAAGSTWWSRIIVRHFLLWFQLFWQCRFVGGGRAVFFCGAYKSFWEKCAWSVLARACGARPVLVMVDGNFPHFFSRLSPSLKGLALRLVRFVDALGVQSRSWELYFESIFPGIRKELVRAGVDTDFFSPGSGTNSQVVNLLYVGWMIEQKGIWDLLDAARLLVDDEVPFILRMVGPAFGAEKQLQSRIVSKGLERVVCYMGPASSRDELREFYRRSDVFVFPSHFEGFPNALLEAASCGLACVSSRVGGCTDILDGGHAGRLVEACSPKALAQAMKELVLDSSLRRRFAEAARRRAVAEFGLEAALHSYSRLAFSGDGRVRD